MPMLRSRSSSLPRARRRPDAAFTIIEVMIGAAIMVLVISTSLIVLAQGMRAVDTARYTTLAGQILQSQMEKIRLLTWSQLTDTTGPVAYTTFTPDLSSTTSSQLNRFVVNGVTGKCAMSVVDAPAPYSSTMKIITLTATWTGIDGQLHTLSYVTRYGQNGISDFFYTSH